VSAGLHGAGPNAQGRGAAGRQGTLQPRAKLVQVGAWHSIVRGQYVHLCGAPGRAMLSVHSLVKTRLHLHQATL
jgi:hypothetical protein